MFQFVQLGFDMNNVGDVDGDGFADISFNVPVGLSGTVYFHQIYAYDPGSTNSYTQSSGLAIRYQ